MKAAAREVLERFRRELAVYRRVLADPRTPRSAKVFLGLALGYFLLPIDLVPDCLPVVGQLDDLVIVPLLLYLALRLIPAGLMAEHRAAVSAATRPGLGDGDTAQPGPSSAPFGAPE